MHSQSKLSKYIIAPVTYTVGNEDIIDVNTSSGGLTTIILQPVFPSNPRNPLTINDVSNNASVGNIVIVTSGGNLINNAASLTLKVDGIGAQIVIGDRDKYIANLNMDDASGGTTVTNAQNGLSLVGTISELGGSPLLHNTTIPFGGFILNLTGGNTGFGVPSPTEKIQIAGNIAPDANGTRDLGTPILGWNNLYLGSNINYSSDLLFKTGGVTAFRMSTTGDLFIADNKNIDVENVGAKILNIGQQNALVINIGTGLSPKVINVGSMTTLLDSINIYGNVFSQQVTNLVVKDKLFTVNDGGAAASGFNTGFEIQENAIITGWFMTNATRNGWDFRAPAISGTATLSLANLTANRTATLQDASGTLAYLSNITILAAQNGLSLVGTNVELGLNPLLHDTNIDLATFYFLLKKGANDLLKVNASNPNGQGILESKPTYAYTTNINPLNYLIAVNSAGEFLNTSILPSQIFIPLKEEFINQNGLTVTLANTFINNINTFSVYKDGILLPSSDFSLSGVTLTFTYALHNNQITVIGQI